MQDYNHEVIQGLLSRVRCIPPVTAVVLLPSRWYPIYFIPTFSLQMSSNYTLLYFNTSFSLLCNENGEGSTILKLKMPSLSLYPNFFLHTLPSTTTHINPLEAIHTLSSSTSWIWRQQEQSKPNTNMPFGSCVNLDKLPCLQVESYHSMAQHCALDSEMSGHSTHCNSDT